MYGFDAQDGLLYFALKISFQISQFFPIAAESVKAMMNKIGNKSHEKRIDMNSGSELWLSGS